MAAELDPGDQCQFFDATGKLFPARVIETNVTFDEVTLITAQDPPKLYGPNVIGYPASEDVTPVPVNNSFDPYTAAATAIDNTLALANVANAAATATASGEAALDATPRPLGEQAGEIFEWDGDQERTYDVTLYKGIRTSQGASGGAKLSTRFEFASKVPIRDVRLVVYDGPPASGDLLAISVARKKSGDATFLPFDLVGGGTSAFSENSQELGQATPQTIILTLGGGVDPGDAQPSNWPCTMRVSVATNGRLGVADRFAVTQWITSKV